MKKAIIISSIVVVILTLFVGIGIALNKKRDLSYVELTESDFYSDNEEKKERYQEYVESALSEYIYELTDRENVSVDATVHNETEVEEVVVHQAGVEFTDSDIVTIEKAVKVFVGNDEVKVSFME